MALDQAAKLRELVRQRAPAARVIAVTSGKGGVGKTNVSIGLALAFASLGKRVVLVDMDLGLANIDVLLDLRSRYNLSHVIAGWKTVDEVMVQGPGGVRILPGATGLNILADLDGANRDRLLEKLQSLEEAADVLLIDTGAGISRNVVKFLLAAQEVVVVTTPEPTAITDAFAVLKVLKRCEDQGLPLGEIKLLVNMARTHGEAERVADSLTGNARRFQNLYVDKLGYLLQDEHVPSAVRKRRHFFLEHPGAPASVCLRNLVQTGFPKVVRAAETPDKPGFFKTLSRFFLKG